MVLTSVEIAGKGIVHGAVPIGERLTTYDATVGSIIKCGVEVDEPSFTLPPRGIVWVVSAETFALPATVTGLATLKTQWTHQGVLALNVGIIDPGWEGPLAAAVVNFSSSPFVIKKGEPFFRILFNTHQKVAVTSKPISSSDYKRQISLQSRAFSDTFLNMHLLTKEVSDEVLKLPRWGYILSVGGLLLGIIAIFAPIAFSVWFDGRTDRPRIQALEKRLDERETDFKQCTFEKRGRTWIAHCSVD